MNRLQFQIVMGLFAVAWSAAEARADFTIGTNFTGNNLTQVRALNGFGIAPPDTDGFIGNTQFVQFTNGQFTVYNKADGSVAAPLISDTTFWNNAGAPAALVNEGLTDTRIIFDPRSQRWFAAEITIGDSTGNNNSVLVAVSNDADATHGFKAVSFPANAGTKGLGDYTQLGVNADGVYVSLNDFKANGNLTENIYSIPKASLLTPTPTLTNMTSFNNAAANTVGFTVQPATDFGASNGHESLLAVNNQFFSQLNRTNILNPAGPGATLSSTAVISVGTTTLPTDAGQPDGTHQVDALDDRFSGNVYKVGNLLYAVHTLTLDGHDALRWYILNEATNAVQEGTLGNSKFDYFQGSIAANANGDVVIGFTRSGTGSDALGPGFLSAFAAVGSTTGGVLTFADPILLKAGVANYHLIGGPGERWGDFSATSVDPLDPNSFWTTQEWAGPNNIWETQVTQILIRSSAVPEPSSIVLGSLGFLGTFGFAAVRHRKARARADI